MKRLLFLILFIPFCARGQYISTICGDGIRSYTGDGGLAKNAKLNWPRGICLDKNKNIYIADCSNGRIRKIDAATGILTTLCGSGADTAVGKFGGDGGLAINADLWYPAGVTTDISGNIYIADCISNRIRKINIATGIINTVAGTGPTGLSTGGYNGDGQPATDAQLSEPWGLCLDKFENVYIPDWKNNRIRKVDAKTGIISTVAGTGIPEYSGDNGPATAAQIRYPLKICVDSSCNIYFSQSDGGTGIYDNVIRKINASTGIITTIAGLGGLPGYTGDNGPATAARLNVPYGLCVDKQQNILFVEWGSGTVRKIDAVTGIITTIAGNGTAGYSGDGRPATTGQLHPLDLTVDDCGIVYVCDFDNNTVRKIANAGVIQGPSNEICKQTFALTDSFPGGRWSSSNPSIATIDEATGIVNTNVAGSTIISYTTDSNNYGCANTATYPILVGPKIIISGTVSPEKCRGNSEGTIVAKKKGGVGPFHYLWSNGDTLLKLTNLPTGTYTLQIKDDSTLCTAKDSFKVTQPDTFAINATITNNNCGQNDGSISTAVTGGTPPYTYLWSTNATSDKLTSLAANTYGLTITDSNGCTGTATAIVADTCDIYQLYLYPNPTTSTLTIELVDTIKDVVIENMIGQRLYHGNYNSKRVVIDVRFLPAGAYFVILNNLQAWRFVRE